MNWPVRVQLADGSVALLRPMRRRDVWRAAATLARLAREDVHVGVEHVNIGRVADRYLLTLNRDGYLYLVAEVESHFAGLASACPGRFGRKDRHVASLSLWISSWAQGRRLGYWMMTTLLAWCREAGYEKAELEVFASNTRARHLYEHLGFAVEVRQRRAIKLPDGRYTDALIMGRLLGGEGGEQTLERSRSQTR